MAGARVYYYWQKTAFFKKAAELNKASVPAWARAHVWASALCLTGKYGDFT
jgi:APA family basic amino acid/polyamine antiporter